MKKFFVNNGAANVGPFEMSVIFDKVNKGELKATDQLCVDIDKDEWMMVCQHAEFVALAQTAKPSIKPSIKSEVRAESVPSIVLNAYPESTKVEVPEKAKLTAVSSDPGAQWYVLKGKNRFGPFLYLDVIRMLQEKSVFEYDFVWCQGQESWKRVAEIPTFSPEHIKSVYSKNLNDEDLFHRRHFPRTKLECDIIVHDNNRVWRGRAIELSEGGAGVVIENAMILPGQNVYLHFKPGAITKPFNVLSEVVSKRFMPGIRSASVPVVYGIKFINIQKQDREAIRTNIAA